MTVLSVAYPFAPVAPETSGGAEQVLAALDRELCRSGHRSIVIACEGSRVGGELVAAPRPDDFRRPALEAARRRYALLVRRTIERRAVDVVHMHGVDFAAYLPPPGPPVLVTLHLPLSWYAPDALRPRRPATWLHGVSAAQCADAPPGVHLLPPIENGVDAAAFAATRKRRSFALVLARLCPEKGIHLALDAAKAAGVPLLVCGALYPYPAHRDYFESEVRPRLDRLRRWIGPVGPARKRRLLAEARCVLIPSLAAETSSLAAREAAAAGAPVIAFASGALKDAVEHGRTGFLVDGVAGMAAAIPRAGEIDSAACRAAARARFSGERMVERYFRLYEGMAAADRALGGAA
jgi:glycosyltransferase involved in cell wall biosynthesis